MLYGYAVTGNMSLAEALEKLDESCEATRDLYLFMLSIISPLTETARARINLAKTKFNPTEEDLNPNTKFVDNKVAHILANDPDFHKITSRKGFSWSQYDVLINSVLDSIKEKSWYKNYMESEDRSLKADCKLFIKIFEREFSDNPLLRPILEDLNVYWIDDLEYALTYCCRTMEELASGQQWHLPELYQSDMLRKKNPAADVQSDKAFVTKLLRNAFTGYEDYYNLVTSSVKGWQTA